MHKNKIKFTFFGTPDVSRKTLEILKQNNYLPSLIVTSQDKPSGRKMILSPSPVKIWATENNIPFLQLEKIDDYSVSEILKYKSEIFIVVAYGKIFPEELIELPSKGILNIHYSLLPKYRGASPVESALLNGDNITGVSIQKMVYKLDSGPVVARKEIAISLEDNKTSLMGKLTKIGGELLVSILPNFLENKLSLLTQDETQASFCHKIKKEDGQINLSDAGLLNYNKYRAFHGWPGVFFFKDVNNKKTRFKITKARLENNIFIIEKVIPEGKKEITYHQ